MTKKKISAAEFTSPIISTCVGKYLSGGCVRQSGRERDRELAAAASEPVRVQDLRVVVLT